MYNKLKDTVKQGCELAPYAIFEYMDNDKDKLYSTYYQIFFNSFKNIELICHAIYIKAYTQAGALLRILIEQVSTLQLLLDNPNILYEYNKFAELKLNYAMNNKDTINGIKN